MGGGGRSLREKVRIFRQRVRHLTALQPVSSHFQPGKTSPNRKAVEVQ